MALRNLSDGFCSVAVGIAQITTVKNKRKREQGPLISSGVLNPGKKGYEVPFEVRVIQQKQPLSDQNADEYDQHRLAVNNTALLALQRKNQELLDEIKVDQSNVNEQATMISQYVAEISALQRKNEEQADSVVRFAKLAAKTQEELYVVQQRLDKANEDWAEDDTAIKNIAKPFGIDIEGNGHDFKDAVEVVEELAERLVKAEASLEEALRVKH